MRVPSLALLAAACLMQLYAAAPNLRADIKSIETNGKYGIKKGYPLKDFNNGLSEAAKANQHDQIEPSADGANQGMGMSSLHNRPAVNPGVETASAGGGGDTDDSAGQDLRIGLGIASTLKDGVTETTDQQPEDQQGVGIASTHQLPDSTPADDLRVGLGIASTYKDPNDVDPSNNQQTEPADIDITGLHESPAVNPDIDITDSADQSNQFQGNGIGISGLHERPAVAPDVANLNMETEGIQGMGISGLHERPAVTPDSANLNTETDGVQGMGISGLHERPAVTPDSANLNTETEGVQGMGISGLHERPAINQEIDMESNNEQPQGMGIAGLHERPAINANANDQGNNGMGIAGLHERPAMNPDIANVDDQENQGIGIAALHERPSVSDFTPKIGLGMASMHERPEMEQNPGRGITNPGVGISAMHERPPLHEQDIQMDALNETLKLSVWQNLFDEEDASRTAANLNDTIYQDLLSLTTAGTQFTVFAPSNDAWDNLSDPVHIALEGPLENVVKNSLLQYHIVPDVTITSSQILGYESKIITTMSGYSLRIFNANGTLKVNGVPMKKADIMASNGVLHTIDTVLVPTHP